MPSQGRPEENITPRPVPCVAHFAPYCPGDPACSSSHGLESDGAALCTPETLTVRVGPRAGTEGVGGAQPGLPCPQCPRKELNFFAPVRLILLLAAPAVTDRIPTFSLAPCLLLKVKFNRQQGSCLVPWGPSRRVPHDRSSYFLIKKKKQRARPILSLSNSLF